MPNAASALFYLWSRSALNVARLRLRRLKQPKYFFGALLAIAYFGFVFLSPLMARRARAARRTTPEVSLLSPDDIAVIATSGAAIMLTMLFVVLWLWRRPRTALQFTEAEVAFLFPGPVRHGTLVHYSLIRNQLMVLVSALFMTLMTLMWSLPSPWWARLIGWWLLMSVISLHTTASGFVLTRLLNRGIAQWQRQVAVALLLLLLVVLLNVLDPELRLPFASEMAPPEVFAAYLYGQIDSGPLRWLLAPLRALAGPFVAADLPAFLLALIPALLVYAVHYAWTFVSEVPDSEVTLANAQKRAALRDALQKGGGVALLARKARTREPFKLRAQGSPVIALLWKNLLSTRDYVSIRTALVVAALMIAWDLWMQLMPGYRLLSALPPMLAMLLGSQVLLVGAQVARQDLRTDLENADLLKTWPLQGWQVVLGELLAPTVILTGLLWLSLLQLGLSAESPDQPWLTPQLRLVAGLSLAMLLPFLCAVQLLIANASVVLFPAWTKPGAGQQHMGVEVIGQRMLFMVGQWIVMFVTLIPALLFGLVIYIPLSWFIDTSALLPAALVAALVLASELAWGISWLGDRFDAYDLSA